MARPTKQLYDMKFGRWTVVDFSHRDKRGSAFWLCRCECGKEKRIYGSELIRGRTRSCGCLIADTARENNTKHGMSAHPAYWVWRSMRDRCRLPTHQAWHNYGGRGIRVCKRWDKFQNFWADMGEAYAPGLTLERLDNDGDYCLKNCSWVTMKEQSNNKRTNRRIETPWGELTVSEASQKSGIGETTLLYRISHGATFRDSLFSKPDLASALHERI